MRNLLTRAMVIGVLVVAPAAAFARGVHPQATTKQPATTQAAATTTTKAPMHATSGVVKSIDGSSLVLAGKNGKETKFTLNASTQKEGAIAVGSHVSVRYENEKGSHVATAVMAKAGKPKATSEASKGTSKGTPKQ